MDKHLTALLGVNMADGAMRTQDVLLKPEVAAGGALIVCLARKDSRDFAVRGWKGLVNDFIPFVMREMKLALKQDLIGVVGAVVRRLDEKDTKSITSEEPPLENLLKMRPRAPPSFWDPESPVLEEMQKVPTAMREEKVLPGEWGSEFGRLAGWDWASSPRMDDVRGLGSSRKGSMPRSKSGEALRMIAVPNGPAGPEGPSRADPGRPDWHSMLAGEQLKETISSGSEYDDSSSEAFPDELTEVTEEDIRASERRSKDRALAVRAAMTNRSLSYGDYLHLPTVLNSQIPQSGIFNKEVHDEMLFIIIHQTYELWFKQILYELDWINSTFEQAVRNGWREGELGLCEQRAGRITQIMRVLVHQMDVLETMQPQGFHDFRDFLNPASGFQSVQFRKLENKLGLRQEQRIQNSGCPYFQHLKHEEEKQEVLESEQGPNLSSLLGRWLGQLLSNMCPGFDFAQYMRNAIEQAAEHDREAIMHYPQYRVDRGQQGKDELLKELEQKRSAHLKLFDRDAHEELIRKGIRQFSFEATMACVFVQSFANELVMQGPHRLMTHIIEIDELIAMWRHRHSLLVLRMLGSKSGTGGSSGHAYLNSVLAKSRIFTDLCHCSHYLLPSNSMPPLPPSIRNRLSGGFEMPLLKPRSDRSKSFG